MKNEYYIKDTIIGIIADEIRLDGDLLWFERKGEIISFILLKFYRLKFDLIGKDGTIHFNLIKR